MLWTHNDLTALFWLIGWSFFLLLLAIVVSIAIVSYWRNQR